MSFLVSDDPSLPNIELIGRSLIQIGRQPQYEIIDQMISKNHLEVQCNMRLRCVYIQSVGVNPSTLNGIEMERNRRYEARHGDFIELIPNQYRYRVDFVMR